MEAETEIIDTIFVEDLQPGDLIRLDSIEEVYNVNEEGDIIYITTFREPDEEISFAYGERIDIYGYAVVEI